MISKSSDVIKTIDTIPLIVSDKRKVNPTFFKVFVGNVDRKQIKLYLVKSDEPFEFYEGFYYYDNEMVSRKIYGFESVTVRDSAFLSIVTDVTSIAMEKEWKSKNVVESFTILNDNMSGIPLAQHSYELNRFGFLGWVTDTSFEGYFSYPYFKNKTGKPAFDNEELDTTNSNRIFLNEILTPFENVEKKSKSVFGESKDTIESVVSLNLPKDTKFEKLKQHILREIFAQGVDSIVSLDGLIENYVVQNLNANTTVISEFKKYCHSKNDVKNYIQIQHKLRLNYFDDNIISFEYRNVQKHSITKSRTFDIRFFNYDVTAKRFLNASEIFKENTYKALERIIEKSEDMKMLKKNFSYAEGLAELNISEFSITKKGFLFRYPPTKELTHDIYIFVPYANLTTVLMEDFKTRCHKVFNY